MSIFLHKNAPSSLHNLLNVLFLDILLIKRVFYVMILTFVGFGYLEMSYSKKIKKKIASHHDLVSSPVSILPLFSNSHSKDVVLPLMGPLKIIPCLLVK